MPWTGTPVHCNYCGDNLTTKQEYDSHWVTNSAGRHECWKRSGRRPGGSVPTKDPDAPKALHYKGKVYNTAPCEGCHSSDKPVVNVDMLEAAFCKACLFKIAKTIDDLGSELHQATVAGTWK